MQNSRLPVTAFISTGCHSSALLAEIVGSVYLYLISVWRPCQYLLFPISVAIDSLHLLQTAFWNAGCFPAPRMQSIL